MNVYDLLDHIDRKMGHGRMKRGGRGSSGEEQWMAPCPSHDDLNPSLAVTTGDDGRPLLHCHAGCDFDDVLAALELTRAELNGCAQNRMQGATYNYRNAAGELLYYVRRKPGKKFVVYGPDGTPGLPDGVARVLYRLPEVRQAIAEQQTIYVCEGEKDVDNAVAAGVVATCNPFGAKKWLPLHTEELCGAHVVVVQDEDTAGREHAEQVVTALSGVAASVTRKRPAQGNDLSDHLGCGLSFDDLLDVSAESAQSAESTSGETDSADTADSAETSPVPLRPPRSPAPFPVNALPEWAATYVTAQAEATQTPPDLAGCCVLGVLAACAGGRAVVEPRAGWREPTNLYLLPIARSGSRKSAVVSAATKPLLDAEEKVGEKMAAQIAETRALKMILQDAATKARKVAAGTDPGEKRDKLIADAISAESTAEAVEVPKAPRFVADDVTPEAAGSLLAENDGRLAIISAEGGIFDVMAGRYSGGIPALDVWLKGHSGDVLRVDRKGRPPEYVKRPALTMLLTVQPVVLSMIARNRTFRGRGLLGRFLYSWPASNVGRRKIGAEPLPDTIAETYATKVGELIEAMIGWTDPAVLRLSLEAQEKLLDVERWIEPRLADEGEFGAMAEWGSKLAGAIVRIAGLLHLASTPNVSEAFRYPISAETMDAAIRLGNYFTGHAQAAFAVLGEQDTTDAAYLLRHLAKGEKEEFTIRSLLTELPRGRFGSAEDVSRVVGILEDHGWVTRQPDPPRRGPGRPPSPRYRVHPSAVSAVSAEPPLGPDTADTADTADTFASGATA